MTQSRLAVLGAGVLLAACGAAAPTPVPPPTPLPPQSACASSGGQSSTCILILGDSIAQGVPLTGDDRWWAGLRSQLAARIPDRHVVIDSWAVPGSRVDVLRSAARDQPVLDSYDLAIVIEGVNDEAWTPLEVWRDEYEAAISAIEQRGLQVVIGTPPPSFENGAFATRYDPVAEALREIAGNRRPLLDIAARWHADGASTAATYYADLIHQGPEGQRLMAAMALDVVLPLLGEAPGAG